MNKRHTTRRQRQAHAALVKARIQALEQQQLPRRAALMLLRMRATAEIRDQAVRFSAGQCLPGGKEGRES